MKIWRTEFIDAIHQIAIAEIAIDVPMQSPSKGIDQRRCRRSQAGHSHGASTLRVENCGNSIFRAQTFDERRDGINYQECNSEDPSSVQVNPQQDGDREKPGDPSRKASRLPSIPRLPSFPPV